MRTFGRETRLDDLNYGVGVPTGAGFKLPAIAGTDFTITTQNGSFAVDLTGNETLAEVATAITSASGGDVTASLLPPGNVLQLLNNTTPLGNDFTITKAPGSDAAQYLGLLRMGSRR
ncbi:MAG: hypothetical protein HC767_03570 [Akkermansiaceae bacterium]|nr:hypothetical protein [Akkermansiaceae bacterium]